MTTLQETTPDATERLVDALVEEIQSEIKSNETAAITDLVQATEPQPLIVHRPVQMQLVSRVVLYWLACVGYFAVVLFITQWMYEPQIGLVDHLLDYLVDMVHWVPAILLLLPLVIFDILKVSQRFLLPIQQVREGIDKINAGQTVELIAPTEEDQMSELVASFNSLRDSALSVAIAEAVDFQLNDPLA
jgi:methyl-accepting chemotaxis protein